VPAPSTSAITLIGRLSRKIHRHPGPAASSPPIGAPPTDDSANIAVSQPCRATNAFRSNNSAIAEIAATISPEPPRPCSARHPISALIDGAAAQASEPRPNTSTEATNMRLRPHRSPKLPCSGDDTATTSRYAAVTPDAEPGSPSDVRIEG